VFVIFLDFDGVLNSHVSAVYYNREYEKTKDWTRYREALCPMCVSNLNYLFEKAPDTLKIVVSSTWRIGSSVPELQKILTDNGFMFSDRVIDMTHVFRKERGYEIQDWLDRHKDVEKFVILDDDADMVHLKPNLVQTNARVGFTLDDAFEVLVRFGIENKDIFC
jgi:hypothetical protein